MAGASNFPHALDTDANLFRRISTDAMVVGDHNNLVDAIESIEATVGIPDDGTAYGGVAFNRGLADHVGLMSTAGPNGRYPWLPRAAGSWYGTDNLTPAGWTLDAGLAVSYGPPKGPAMVSWPVDTTQRLLRVALPGAAPYHVLARVRVPVAVSAQALVMGFSALGSMADIAGVGWGTSSPFDVFVAGASVASVGGYAGPGPASPWLYVWLTLSATELTVRVSGDGCVYDVIGVQAVVLAATQCVLAVKGSGSADGRVEALWLDYIGFGSTAPQGQ